MTEENAPDSDTEVLHVDKTKTLAALTEETARGKEFVENIVKETYKVEVKIMGKATIRSSEM